MLYHITGPFSRAVLASFFGLVSCVASIVAFGAPLSKLPQVLRDKSTDSMPFLVSLLGFLCSLAWLLAGVQRNDIFMIVPNGLGFLLGLAQLALFWQFHGNSKAGFKRVELIQVPNQIETM